MYSNLTRYKGNINKIVYRDELLRLVSIDAHHEKSFLFVSLLLESLIGMHISQSYNKTKNYPVYITLTCSFQILMHLISKDISAVDTKLTFCMARI